MNKPQSTSKLTARLWLPLPLRLLVRRDPVEHHGFSFAPSRSSVISYDGSHSELTYPEPTLFVEPAVLTAEDKIAEVGDIITPSCGRAARQEGMSLVGGLCPKSRDWGK